MEHTQAPKEKGKTVKRINPYADPFKQAETREYNEIGCGGCIHNIPRLGGGHQCRQKQGDFPNADVYTCTEWQRNPHAADD